MIGGTSTPTPFTAAETDVGTNTGTDSACTAWAVGTGTGRATDSSIAALTCRAFTVYTSRTCLAARVEGFSP
eukprot:13808980-Ditylum_brightwellii.AAC.1